MKPLFIILLTLFPIFIFPQVKSNTITASNAALSNMKAVIDTSFYNNLGLGYIGYLSENSISFSTINRYHLNELSTYQLQGYVNNDFFNSEITIAFTGDHLCNHGKISLAIANLIDQVGLGLRLNYIQQYIEGLQSRTAFNVDFAGTFPITDQFSFAAQINDLSVQKKNENYEGSEVIVAGISWLVTKSATLFFEVEKEIGLSEVIKLAAQFKLNDWIKIRSGISSGLRNVAAGFNLSHKKWLLDYAYQYHLILGDQHAISFSFII